MRIPFTKMQGAGNDFVVLDETRGPFGLQREHYRFLANRRFGVGADQILTVGPAPAPDIDFSYRIHNADGGEVEHCGNGARCFVRFVREQGLTAKCSIRVAVQRGVITLHERPDGLVTVDMGAPLFEPAALPFVPGSLSRRQQGEAPLWRLSPMVNGRPLAVEVALACMGNPHAVIFMKGIDDLDLPRMGPSFEHHPLFPKRTNTEFVEVLSSTRVRMRVWERGAGETLACGTGACAVAVACVLNGYTGRDVEVELKGGTLKIHWDESSNHVHMTGGAVTVFAGEYYI